MVGRDEGVGQADGAGRSAPQRVDLLKGENGARVRPALPRLHHHQAHFFPGDRLPSGATAQVAPEQKEERGQESVEEQGQQEAQDQQENFSHHHIGSWGWTGIPSVVDVSPDGSSGGEAISSP